MSPGGPLVGIPLRPQPGTAGRPPRQIINDAYVAALERAGAVPLPLPLLAAPEALRRLYERCEALCLPGGADVDPRHYGEEPRADLGTETQPELDAHELRLLGWALEDDLPVLAICRGMQLLTVALGGSLWQDAERQGAASGHDGHDGPRHRLLHDLEVAPGSRLEAVLGAARVRVNSLHHQAVREVGPRLRVSGRSEDGLVEAVELPDRRFVVGVQCHPEELGDDQPWASHLFDALVKAASAPPGAR